MKNHYKKGDAGWLPSIRAGVFLFFILFMGSCEKHPFDHRNKYLEKWDFNTQMTKVNIDSIGQNSSGYEYYFGEIKHGDNDNQIVIEFMKGKDVRIEIDKTGKISNYGTHYGSGYIDVDELNLYLRYGGLGGFVDFTINGKR